MNKTKKLVPIIQLALAIAFIPLNYGQMWAMSIKSLSKTKLPIIKKLRPLSQRFQTTNRAVPPPPPIGAPTRRSNAGSRGDCQNSSRQNLSTKTKHLTALAPIYQTNNSDSIVWGLTTAEQPYFWFYVPYQLTSNQSMVFVLKDDQGNYLYRTKLAVNNMIPGILGVHLPSDVSLKTEQNYYSWGLLIYCDLPKPSSYTMNYVNGLIKRVQLPKLEENKQNSLKPAERASLYAQKEIWYDALTELAKLRLANPQNEHFRDEWISLLQSLDLEDFAKEPLINLYSHVLKPVAQ